MIREREKETFLGLVQLGGGQEERKRVEEVRCGEKLLSDAGNTYAGLPCSFLLLSMSL